MKKSTLAIYGLAAMAALNMTVACSGGSGKMTDPAQLGNLAAVVENASPREADQLLSKAGYNEASFRKAIEEIMEDPDRVVTFTKAYQKAKG